MRSKNHLNKEIRNIIEELLDKNYNFTKISKVIYKDRRTISREILNHRVKKYPGGFNDQVNYYCENNCNKLCKDKNKTCYKEKICIKLLTPLMYVTVVKTNLLVNITLNIIIMPKLQMMNIMKN